MKWDLDWNLRNSGVDWDLYEFYLIFLSREIDIKLCQNYTKMYICKILYKIRSVKQIIFNKYATNLKTMISQRSLRISGWPLLLFEFNNFSFLIFDGSFFNLFISGFSMDRYAYYVCFKCGKSYFGGEARYYLLFLMDHNNYLTFSVI